MSDKTTTAQPPEVTESGQSLVWIRRLKDGSPTWGVSVSPETTLEELREMTDKALQVDADLTAALASEPFPE